MRVESKNSLAPGHFQSDTGPNQTPRSSPGRAGTTTISSRQSQPAMARSSSPSAGPRRAGSAPGSRWSPCTRRRRAARSALRSTRAASRLAEKERQHVVAVLALVRRGVDLDAVAEAEQPLGARAMPHQRVEGREQRPRLDPPRPAGGGLEVGGAAPALDLDRDQRARPRRARRAGRAPPSPGAGNSRADRARSRRRAPGRDRISPRCASASSGVGASRIAAGEDALGQVVDALEAAPRRRRHAAGPEQPLERVLAVAPAPPGAAPGAALGELAAR